MKPWYRFFLPPEQIDCERVVIRGRLVHQLRDVLRMRAGDKIKVLDNRGWEYLVELTSLDKGEVAGVITDKTRAADEPQAQITIYQALLKGHKFEFVLQKGTELGVVAFGPMFCQRCIVEGEKAARDKQSSRWQRVITEATEQSQRGKIPLLYPARSFTEVCKSVGQLSLLLWEEERETSIRHALEHHLKEDIKKAMSINILVGPEGGFTKSEVEYARGCGILSVGLGNRILRAETAGLVAASVILYHCGDLGG